MRLHHVHHLIAVTAIVLFAFGLKSVIPTVAAVAEAPTLQAPTLNALQMQRDFPNVGKLAQLKMHDMTFALD